jgi:hypothetical protein
MKLNILENFMAIEVKCINKGDRYNPHKAITHIGGINPDGTSWKLSQTDAIAGIESGQYDFFVSSRFGIVKVIVATRNGNKYLKTENDGESPNNLLSLPECS